MNILEQTISDMDHRVAAGTGTQVKLEFDGVEIPVHSTIVGLEHDKYIILKSPEPFQPIEHKIYPGSELILRYLTDGTVYAFQTRIIETIDSPVMLVFVEYPRIIQHHDLRDEKRLECHVPVRLIAGDRENMGCIVDLATTGCRCLVQGRRNPSPIRFSQDQPLVLKCLFPGSKNIVSLPGRVKNIKRGNREVDLGIMFAAKMPESSRRVVSWYLAAIKDFRFRGA